MNKAINLFSGIILTLYCGFVMATVYDLSFSTFTFNSVPFKLEICYGFSLIVLLFGVLRIKRKWQGAIDMKRFKGFHFERKISRSAINLSLVYAISEAVFMALLIVFLIKITKLSPDYVLPMLIVVSIILLESLIFIFKINNCGPSFRLGINKKAVAYFNREMRIIYFTGLKRIELHQDMISFQYREDLNIFFPLELLNNEDRIPFRDALIQTIEDYVNTNDGKIIYIDDAFRNLE